LEGASDELEARILGAAARLVTHYGYDKTTIDEIAREAGVAKSTLYARWNSKQSLFNAVLWRQSILFMDDWLARVEADPEGGSFAGMFRLAVLALEENGFMRAVYSDNRRVLGSLLSRPELRGIYREQQQSTSYMLQALQQVGVVRADLDVVHFSYVAVALRYGLLNFGQALPDEDSPPMERITAVMGDMIGAFLEPPEGGDHEAGKAVIRQMVGQMRDRLKAFEEREL
jgi:TetR/AcrR family acrAB operon transcriptional repressor